MKTGVIPTEDTLRQDVINRHTVKLGLDMVYYIKEKISRGGVGVGAEGSLGVVGENGLHRTFTGKGKPPMSQCASDCTVSHHPSPVPLH